MARPYICFVTTHYPPEIGGVSRSSYRIVTNLAKLGFTIHVFVRTPNLTASRWHYSEPIGRVSVYRVPDVVDDLVQTITIADSVIKFDLFHGFFLTSAYPCIKVARRSKRPTIASIRGSDGMKLYTRRAVKILQEVSWITSVSTDSLARASQIVDVSQYSSFIPNGIDLGEIAPWVPTTENDGVVGTIADFRPKKNMPLLLNSYACLPSQVRKHLLLVGDFPTGNPVEIEQRQQFLELIEERRLENEVTITGYIPYDQVMRYLRKMRVFVLSSDHEGLPNAILEAAALGMPIVATAVDGVKDIFQDHLNALLVKPGEMGALSSAIETVLTNSELAHSLGRSALEVAKKYTPAVEQQAYARLYWHLMDSSDPERMLNLSHS